MAIQGDRIVCSLCFRVVLLIAEGTRIPAHRNKDGERCPGSGQDAAHVDAYRGPLQAGAFLLNRTGAAQTMAKDWRGNELTDGDSVRADMLGSGIVVGVSGDSIRIRTFNPPQEQDFTPEGIMEMRISKLPRGTVNDSNGSLQRFAVATFRDAETMARASGSVYELEQGGNWRTAADDEWEIEVETVDGPVVGQRRIDGALCVIIESNGRFYGVLKHNVEMASGTSGAQTMDSRFDGEEVIGKNGDRGIITGSAEGTNRVHVTWTSGARAGRSEVIQIGWMEGRGQPRELSAEPGAQMMAGDAGDFRVGDRVGEIAPPHRRGRVVLIDQGMVVVKWTSDGPAREKHEGYPVAEAPAKLKKYGAATAMAQSPSVQLGDYINIPGVRYVLKVLRIEGQTVVAEDSTHAEHRFPLSTIERNHGPAHQPDEGWPSAGDPGYVPWGGFSATTMARVHIPGTEPYSQSTIDRAVEWVNENTDLDGPAWEQKVVEVCRDLAGIDRENDRAERQGRPAWGGGGIGGRRSFAQTMARWKRGAHVQVDRGMRAGELGIVIDSFPSPNAPGGDSVTVELADGSHLTLPARDVSDATPFSAITMSRTLISKRGPMSRREVRQALFDVDAQDAAHASVRIGAARYEGTVRDVRQALFREPERGGPHGDEDAKQDAEIVVTMAAGGAAQTMAAGPPRVGDVVSWREDLGGAESGPQAPEVVSGPVKAARPEAVLVESHRDGRDIWVPLRNVLRLSAVGATTMAIDWSQIHPFTGTHPGSTLRSRYGGKQWVVDKLSDDFVTLWDGGQTWTTIPTEQAEAEYTVVTYAGQARARSDALTMALDASTLRDGDRVEFTEPSGFAGQRGTVRMDPATSSLAIFLDDGRGRVGIQRDLNNVLRKLSADTGSALVTREGVIAHVVRRYAVGGQPWLQVRTKGGETLAWPESEVFAILASAPALATCPECHKQVAVQGGRYAVHDNGEERGFNCPESGKPLARRPVGYAASSGTALARSDSTFADLARRHGAISIDESGPVSGAKFPTRAAADAFADDVQAGIGRRPRIESSPMNPNWWWAQIRLSRTPRAPRAASRPRSSGRRSK